MMTEKLLKCSWCQSENKVPGDLVFMEGETAHYICADCFIPMMPSSLEDDEKGESHLPEDEKRLDPRYPVFAPVRISPQDHGVRITSALIVDASDSGLKINTKLPLKKDEKIVFGLFGSNSSFQAVGDVAYVKLIGTEENPQYRVGVKLVELQNPDQGSNNTVGSSQ